MTQAALTSFSSDAPDRGVVEAEKTERCAPAGAHIGDRVREVLPGDVVWFVHRRMHSHVTATDLTVPTDDDGYIKRPKTVRVRLLDGYAPGYSVRVSRESMNRLAQQGDVRVTHTVVERPEARWGNPTGTRHPNADVNRCTPVSLAPRATTDVQQVQREWQHDEINGLLEHPIADHRLGRRQFLRAAWTARRPDGRPTALAVLTRPNAPSLGGGETVELARYVSHPDATESHVGTNNTATWLIAKVARWAALEGFERLLSYSGVADNDGGIYGALPFEFDTWSDANPSDWNSRSGRTAAVSVRSQKKRWVWNLHDTPTYHPRRAAAREDGRGGLSAFATRPAVDARPPANFALTREERSHYYRDDSGTPVAGRAHDLFREAGPGDDVLATRRRMRAGNDKPPAVFGATVDGTLVAAVAVAGSPLPKAPVREAEIVGYAARDTAYPENTTAWLLSRVREWAALAGYESLHAHDGVLATVDGVNPASVRGRAGLSAEDSATPL